MVKNINQLKQMRIFQFKSEQKLNRMAQTYRKQIETKNPQINEHYTHTATLQPHFSHLQGAKRAFHHSFIMIQVQLFLCL